MGAVDADADAGIAIHFSRCINSAWDCDNKKLMRITSFNILYS